MRSPQPRKLLVSAAAAGLATIVAALSPSQASAAPASAASIDAGGAVTFRLPWGAGASEYLTQDADDSCCSDHVGANKFAFDFALPSGGAFDVVAPAAGTIVHVKMSSSHGCGEASCVNDANYVVIDHGDGTQTTMLHLAQGSLDPMLSCGSFVRAGQRLATTGSTGWSTGVHLHVERDRVKRDLKKTCECGADGMACPASSVEWSLFWPSIATPNVPVVFDEWKSSASPDNRRGLIGPSHNADAIETVAYVDGSRFSTLAGDWSDADVGGRTGAFKYAKAGARGALSLKGSTLQAGLYQVWAYVPISQLDVADATLQVRAASGASTAEGTLDHASTKGGFHLVRGLERVRLEGDESITIAASESTDATAAGEGADGRFVTFDSLVLHRIAPPIDVATAPSPRLEAPSAQQLGLAMAAKGGGIVVDDAPAASPEPDRPSRAPYGLAGASALGVAAGVAFAMRRRRGRARPSSF